MSFGRNLAQNLYKSQITQTVPSIGSTGNLNDEFEINVSVAPKYNSGWIFIDFADAAKRDLIYFHSRTGNILKYYRKNRDLLGIGASTIQHSQGAYIQIHDVSEWINFLSNNTSDFGFVEYPYSAPLSIRAYGGRVNYGGPVIVVSDATIAIPASSTKEIIFDFADNAFKAIDTVNLASYVCFHCGTIVTDGTQITSYTEMRQAYLGTKFSSAFFEFAAGQLILKDNGVTYNKLETSVQNSLLQAHSHSNKLTVLDLFTTSSGVLYFNGTQIALNNQAIPIISVSSNFIGPVYASLAALNAAFPSPQNGQQGFYCILQGAYYDCTGGVFLPRNNSGTTINAAILAGGKVALPSPANITAGDNTDVNGNPLVVQPGDLKNVKDTLDAAIAGATPESFRNNQFITGEALAVNDAVSIEDIPSMSYQVTTDTGMITNGANATSTSSAMGHRIQARRRLRIVSVTKTANTAATRALIKTDTGNTILASATFVGNVATFSTPYSVAGLAFVRVECDGNGGSVSLDRNLSPSYPLTGGNIEYNNSSTDGSNSSFPGGISSIQTDIPVVTTVIVGGSNSTKRQGFRVLGNGTPFSSFQAIIGKTGTPTQNLNIRIEGESSNAPDGNLVTNGSASIAHTSLGLLGDIETITLAGSTTLSAGVWYWVIFYQGTYGSETVSSINCYHIGLTSNHTLSRGRRTYDQNLWDNYQMDGVDLVYSETLNLSGTNAGSQAVTQTCTFTANQNTIIKNVICDSVSGTAPTLSSARIEDMSGNILCAGTINTLTVTFPTTRLASGTQYKIIIVGTYSSFYPTGTSYGGFSVGAAITVNSQVTSFSGAHIFMKTITTNGITTLADFKNEMLYILGAGFERYMLCKANAQYTYKTNFLGFAKNVVAVGAIAEIITDGFKSGFSALSHGLEYFLTNTAGVLGLSPGTNKYRVSRAVLSNTHYIDKKNLSLFTISVPASNASYQNTSSFNMKIQVTGGTVTLVKTSRDNTTYYTEFSTTNCAVVLAPGDYLIITYSVAPTLTGLYI